MATLKGIIRKSKLAQSTLTTKLILNKENNYNKITITNKFIKYSANVGPTLICPVTQFFEYPIKKTDSQINKNPPSINETQEVSFSLEMNDGEINVNILQRLVSI